MSAIRIILFGTLALLLAGCGQIVTENLPAPPAPPPYAVDRTVVLMPLADYSYGDDAALAYARNMAIMENLTDQLTFYGFHLPVQEDVFDYLVDNKIIDPEPYGDGGGVINASLERELNGEWSEEMKGELSRLLDSEKSHERRKMMDKAGPLKTPGTHGLDRQAIARVGRTFGADYIIRGRIIEYRLRQDMSWQPLRRGLLPVIFGASNRLLFGFASSEGYDTVNSMLLGGVAGAITGNNLTSPFNPPGHTTEQSTTSGPLPFSTTTSKTVSSGGTDDYHLYNSLAWGAAGAGAAFLADQGGDLSQAVVELRLWVQDGTTGKVIWTNRAEVRVAPESVFADNEPQALFDTAVSKTVTALVDDFLANTDL